MPTENAKIPSPALWHKQLKMACRRGNAESELLLNAYLEHLIQQQASYHDLQPFESLLETNDPSLLTWLMQPESAPKHFQPLIQKIKTAYLNSL
jgi:antitoxin CptB